MQTSIPRSGPLLGAAVFTLTSGLIYVFGAARADVSVDRLIAMLLAGCGLVQVSMASGLVVRPTRRLLYGAAGSNLLLIALWAVSRGVGLPLGPAPWSPWQLGTTDLICSSFEVLAAFFVLWLLVRPVLRPTRWAALRAAFTTLLALFSATYLGFAATVTADVDVPAQPLSDVHVMPGQMTTFTYCTPDHYGLAMDFYEPSDAAQHPVPVVLQIHGGVGIYGDRKDVLIPSVASLTEAGFAVASIDYRRAPIVVMSNQVQDAKCAVRFLRANAAALGIDPDRFGAFGHSEGGWLSAMLGLAAPDAGFDVGEYSSYSSQVQAVVDEAGPADVPRLLAEGPAWMPQAAFVLYHGQPVTALPDNSSVDYARPDAPPFLIVQGTDDEVIPFHQSAELTERLQLAGDSVQFIAVQHGPHDLKSESETPDAGQLGQMVRRFFQATLQASFDTLSR